MSVCVGHNEPLSACAGHVMTFYLTPVAANVPLCNPSFTHSGTKDKEKPGDRIIWHPDIRRMLLSQKAFAEGGRCLLYRLGKLSDKFFGAKDEKTAAKIEDEMGLYTPVLKGFLTELSQEAAYYGQQVCFALCCPSRL